MATKFTGESLDKVISSYQEVLIDFYADWCNPCKVMSPVLEKFEDIYKIPVVKVDIESYPELTDQYKVLSIPTLILFRNGRPVWRYTGFIPFNKLVDEIFSGD